MNIRTYRVGQNPKRPRPSSRFEVKRGAFTLLELIVAIGIITVLVAITLPVIGQVRDSSRRAMELSNLRQLCTACIVYAQNNNDLLPCGRVAFAPSGWDDYTWVSYTSCWSPLVQISPALNHINSCASVLETYPDADDFGSPASEYGASDDTQVGWIYWGGRDDLMLNGVLQYRSPRRLGRQLTPGSRTLWTCLCWDSAGNGGSSVCPHVGTGCVIYPNGVALKPPPDGLNVALDDGSASFVHWQDLITIQQANGYKLYYEP